MAAPTNQDLLTKYPTDLVSKLEPNLEIWEVTSHYLVEKGTNVEQLVADLYDGKYVVDPSMQTILKAVIPLKDFGKVAPVAGSKMPPSNPFLVQSFPADLMPRVDSASDLWAVVSRYLVEAGTDVEQMFVDNMNGKFADLTPAMSPSCKAIQPVSDITKIA